MDGNGHGKERVDQPVGRVVGRWSCVGRRMEMLWCRCKGHSSGLALSSEREWMFQKDKGDLAIPKA